MSRTNDSGTAEQHSGTGAKGHGLDGLIGILISIVVGALVGVFYGRTMWLATEGPTRAIARLEKTIPQKEQLADDYQRQSGNAVGEEGDRLQREAERIRGHIPKIEQEISRLQLLQQQAQQNRQTTSYWVASLVHTLSQFFGDIFLQTLKLLVIPLVVTSMICGITSLGDIRKVGRLGGWTLAYYFSTTAIAVFIGIVLVLAMQPGTGADDTFAYVDESVPTSENASALQMLLDVVRGRRGEPGSGMFPSNIFLAASETNVLALIVFALVFGGALTTVGDHGRVVIDFFNATNEVVMKMVGLVIWFAPLGIYGLVATKIAENGGGDAFITELFRLGKYVAAVCLGLALHSLVLCGILSVFGKRNPIIYTYNILRALLTAFSTSSSSATLPISIECVEDNNKVSSRSAGFVLPLGATVNMDGTALYEAVAVIFIAQALGIKLALGQLIVVFLTATLAAIGAAGIPQAGLVTMVMVLTAVGIPTSGIGTILAIDWFLDRLRTTVNVFGDTIGAAVIDANVTT
ncbi:MAG: cation:dicarboxylase symporter family transporter [Pirellulaceae bacterium]|nr:dicarboxylate/amino acid:cation symporter [Planctomycetales bacterium]